MGLADTGTFPRGGQATASAAASADNDRAADPEPASGSAAEPADASPNSSADASPDSSADTSPDEADTGPDQTHRAHARQGNGAATGPDADVLRCLQHVLRFCRDKASAELGGEEMATLVRLQDALSDAQHSDVTQALDKLATLAIKAFANWISGRKVTGFGRERRTFSARDDVFRKMHRLWAKDRGGRDFSKLAKLLGMLGSNQDGELLNAARAAEQERKRLGLTWVEIFGCEVDAEAAT
jgi:hypothetical protein